MNKNVIIKLPSVADTGGVYAVLARLDGKQLFTFLAMPTQIMYERNSNYSSSNIRELNNPIIQFSGLDSHNMTINNLSLSTFVEKKSLHDYIDSLQKLSEPGVGEFVPPVLMFKWGNRLFSPCVITRFSKTETFWFRNGDLASATVSLSLMKVNETQIIK